MSKTVAIVVVLLVMVGALLYALFVADKQPSIPAPFKMTAGKPVYPPLELATPYPIGEVGVSYFAPLLKGGKQPYKCSVVAGMLPPGLTLDKNCNIVGTPTQSSTNSLIAVK